MVFTQTMHKEALKYRYIFWYGQKKPLSMKEKISKLGFQNNLEFASSEDQFMRLIEKYDRQYSQSFCQQQLILMIGSMSVAHKIFEKNILDKKFIYKKLLLFASAQEYLRCSKQEKNKVLLFNKQQMNSLYSTAIKVEETIKKQGGNEEGQTKIQKSDLRDGDNNVDKQNKEYKQNNLTNTTNKNNTANTSQYQCNYQDRNKQIQQYAQKQQDTQEYKKQNINCQSNHDKGKIQQNDDEGYQQQLDQVENEPNNAKSKIQWQPQPSPYYNQYYSQSYYYFTAEPYSHVGDVGEANYSQNSNQLINTIQLQSKQLSKQQEINKNKQHHQQAEQQDNQIADQLLEEIEKQQKKDQSSQEIHEQERQKSSQSNYQTQQNQQINHYSASQIGDNVRINPTHYPTLQANKRSEEAKSQAQLQKQNISLDKSQSEGIMQQISVDHIGKKKQKYDENPYQKTKGERHFQNPGVKASQLAHTQQNINHSWDVGKFNDQMQNQQIFKKSQADSQKQKRQLMMILGQNTNKRKVVQPKSQHQIKIFNQNINARIKKQMVKRDINQKLYAYSKQYQFIYKIKRQINEFYQNQSQSNGYQKIFGQAQSTETSQYCKIKVFWIDPNFGMNQTIFKSLKMKLGPNIGLQRHQSMTFEVRNQIQNSKNTKHVIICSNSTFTEVFCCSEYPFSSCDQYYDYCGNQETAYKILGLYSPVDNVKVFTDGDLFEHDLIAYIEKQYHMMTGHTLLTQ